MKNIPNSLCSSVVIQDQQCDIKSICRTRESARGLFVRNNHGDLVVTKEARMVATLEAEQKNSAWSISAGLCCCYYDHGPMQDIELFQSGRGR